MIIVVGIRDSTGNHLGVFIDEDEIVKNTYVECMDWNWPDKLLYIKACIGENVPDDKICGSRTLRDENVLSGFVGAYYIFCHDNGMISYSNLDAEDPNPTGYRKLTLSDLKTKRTRTEYIKITDSIFDLRPDFERGELYYNFGGNWFSYDDELSLVTGFREQNIYRKVEKEIDERQEFIDKAYYLAQSTGSYDVDEIAGAMYEAGCRFVGDNGEIE